MGKAAPAVCIALFSGINVGKTRSLPMKDLTRILEGLGYQDIKTYIQSGNVVFRSKKKCTGKDAGNISNAVEAEFGFRPDVMLLGASDLDAAVKRNPFPTDRGKFLHFFFMDTKPTKPDLKALEAVKAGSEQFRLEGRVFYLYTPDGFGRSKLAERVERKLGVGVTARNFNTVSKLVEMADA
jgi:uncharacterized protein (DUF1697 family)